jgi:hypothetical protein
MIQCLASSEMVTPHPLNARRVCTPPPLVRGEDTLAGLRGGGGVNSSENARHCSVLYICKYFGDGSLLVSSVFIYFALFRKGPSRQITIEYPESGNYHCT